MLFSEARHLVPGLDAYTMEHAHNQVLAIRLMNYDNGNNEQLKKIIEYYRTFDEATDCLRQLSRDQVSDWLDAHRVYVEWFQLAAKSDHQTDHVVQNQPSSIPSTPNPNDNADTSAPRSQRSGSKSHQVQSKNGSCSPRSTIICLCFV